MCIVILIMYVTPGSSATGSGEFKRKLNRLKKYVNSNSLLHGDNSLESGNRATNIYLVTKGLVQ